ncbi:MAG: RnfH family protein [Pseudomonadota bacterium]|nr:RnfH family protein [Pseudomonadota bacterium]
MCKENKISVQVAWMHTSEDINVQTHYLRMGISLSEFINILSVDEKMPKGWGVSIFGEKKSMDYILQENDRVELCLSLLNDPLLRRRARVKNKKRKG